jgi:hypothetical protein
MPSTYTVNLGIEKPATGEQSGTWGDTTNVNFDIIDQAVNGSVRVTLTSAGTSGSPNDLSIVNGSTTSSEGRNKWIEIYSASDLGGSAYVRLVPNDAEKILFIRNSLAGSQSVLLFQGTYNASNDLEIPAGVDMVVKFDGAGASATVTDVFTKLRATEITTPTLTAGTADINGGSVDGATVGAASASTGAFTTLTASTSLNIASSTTVDGVLDEDNMSSDSATKLATQQSIKAYVDSQVGAVDTLAEILANGNTSGANNLIINNGQALTSNTINETTLAAGVTVEGVLLKDSAISGAGISLTSNTLSGTLAEFNAALSGDDFVSLTGTETLTNKTLTAPTVNSATLTGVVTAPTQSPADNSTKVATTAYVDAATLTTEEVQDIVGGMVTGNTESGITVTYQDVDGKLDFIVGGLDTSAITTGTFADARIAQTNVTQHQAALSLTASQISDVTSTAAELNLLDGSIAGTIVNSKGVVYGAAGEVNATTLQIAGTSITSTAAELNILDGVTSTAAELNLLDGSIAGTIVNSKGVVYGAAGEVNATTLQIAGTSITSTAAEINLLDGVTATTAELNYLDVTTLGTTEASKAVTADANGVVTFDNGVSEEYTAVTSSSNATTVNLRDGTNFSHTLTENTTFTFSNPASSGKVSSFTLKIVQDASASGYTVTWPTSVDWPAATAPTLTATASAVDYFVFITHDGGTTWYGFTAGQAFG